jgi:hypothetical protein
LQQVRKDVRAVKLKIVIAPTFALSLSWPLTNDGLMFKLTRTDWVFWVWLGKFV